jgi:hypothetical protein
MAVVAAIIKDRIGRGWRVVWSTVVADRDRDNGVFVRNVSTGGGPRGPRIRLMPAAYPLGYVFASGGAAGGYVTVYETGYAGNALDVQRFSADLQRFGKTANLIDKHGTEFEVDSGSAVCSAVRRRCLAAWGSFFVPYSMNERGPPDSVDGALINLDHPRPSIGASAPLADTSSDPAAGAMYPTLLRAGYGRLLLAWAGGSATGTAGGGPGAIFVRVLHVPW